MGKEKTKLANLKGRTEQWFSGYQTGIADAIKVLEREFKEK